MPWSVSGESSWCDDGGNQLRAILIGLGEVGVEVTVNVVVEKFYLVVVSRD